MPETYHQARADLPASVYDLALRLGVKPDGNRAGVKLTQTGRIKRNIDTESWMAFTATQTISTQTCEFDWRARAGPFGMVSARDALKNDEGLFDIQFRKPLLQLFLVVVGGGRPWLHLSLFHHQRRQDVLRTEVTRLNFRQDALCGVRRFAQRRNNKKIKRRYGPGGRIAIASTSMR
jgi:hypothetical protein